MNKAELEFLSLFPGHWNVPVWKRNAKQEYLDAHIEGAVRFDIAEVADKAKTQPLMLPPPNQFAEQVGQVLPLNYIIHY